MSNLQTNIYNTCSILTEGLSLGNGNVSTPCATSEVIARLLGEVIELIELLRRFYAKSRCSSTGVVVNNIWLKDIELRIIGFVVNLST